ncbi:hypothetical protein Salat_2353800 [Sesamum alatum]|uniref:4Fe-4S ferredoxin-type domain-containing protein n=1 Tax=Sesamum alatum TaxID=300844 RepID=A0AAE1XWS2_9LAMI|nr:hypothetical protein Salat_2353800 [Sesamum alatum]
MVVMMLLLSGRGCGGSIAARRMSIAGFKIHVQDDALAVTACGLGGGSLVNAGEMLQTTARARRDPRWPKDWEKIGTDDRQKSSEVSEFQDHGRVIGEEYEENIDNPMKLSMNFDIEEHVSNSRRSQETGSCLACGNCIAGCPYNAKNSPDIFCLWMGTWLLVVAWRNRRDKARCRYEAQPKMVLNAIGHDDSSRVLTLTLTFSSLALQYEPHTEPRSFSSCHAAEIVSRHPVQDASKNLGTSGKRIFDEQPGFIYNASSGSKSGNDLVRTLLKDGRDMRLLHARHWSSPSNHFSLEHIGRIDIPSAINKIVQFYAEPTKVHVVAHCLGGLATHMSIMRGHVSTKHIASLSCTNSSMFFKLTTSSLSHKMHYWMNKENLPRFPMAAFPHLRRIWNSSFIVNSKGNNSYPIHSGRMAFPTLYISGGRTLLVTPETSFVANNT